MTASGCLAGRRPVAAHRKGRRGVRDAGRFHYSHNDFAVPTQPVGVYVIEKGKVLATPAF